MSAELIYKTDSPVALQWWDETEAALEADRVRLAGLIDEWTLEFGRVKGAERDIYVRRGWGGERIIDGMKPSEPETINPPTGWRFDKTRGYLVPALRTTEGKALAKKMRDMRGTEWRKDIEKIGVPSSLILHDGPGTNHVYNAGFEFDDQARVLYQTWGTVWVEKDVLEEQKKNSEITQIVWVECPRSEYFAFKERAEAQRA